MCRATRLMSRGAHVTADLIRAPGEGRRGEGSLYERRAPYTKLMYGLTAKGFY